MENLGELPGRGHRTGHAAAIPLADKAETRTSQENIEISPHLIPGGFGTRQETNNAGHPLAPGNGLGDEFDTRAAGFLALQPWATIAALDDDGRVWTSLLTGAPVSPRTLPVATF